MKLLWLIANVWLGFYITDRHTPDFPPVQAILEKLAGAAFLVVSTLYVFDFGWINWLLCLDDDEEEEEEPKEPQPVRRNNVARNQGDSVPRIRRSS